MRNTLAAFEHGTLKNIDWKIYIKEIETDHVSSQWFKENSFKLKVSKIQTISVLLLQVTAY
jgi:hypothetical protein